MDRLSRYACYLCLKKLNKSSYLQEYRDKASKQAQTKGNENLMNLENARDDDDESRPANDIENNATTEVSVISKSLQTSVSLRADSKVHNFHSCFHLVSIRLAVGYPRRL